MNGQWTHVPVLLTEVMEGLKINEDGTYLDGTFGRGGHAREILRRLGPTGRLLLMDRDPQAIATATGEFGGDVRVRIRRDNLRSCHIGRKYGQVSMACCSISEPLRRN